MAVLREDGVFVVEPGAGELACGVYGSGRMAEPESIVAEVKLRLQVERKTDLRELHVVITAGGTREPIDAVRYIGNRSSGKMGFALARAAFDRGASVDLIEANIHRAPAPGVREIEARTAAQMHDRVIERLPDTDVLIMAAAVADYQPTEGPAGGKVGKSRDEWAIRLEPTVDILADVAGRRNGDEWLSEGGLRRARDLFVVGFAAEYGEEGLARAREKLHRKGLDMIVFNDISRTDIGFDSDYNEVVILTSAGETRVERAPKERIAETHPRPRRPGASGAPGARAGRRIAGRSGATVAGPTLGAAIRPSARPTGLWWPPVRSQGRRSRLPVVRPPPARRSM